MKISIIGYKESSVNIFASLAKELSKKISGLELEERFVPELEDIPEIALECTTESDFVVVFALSEEKELVEQIKEKLIDVELKTKVRILKEIRDDSFSSLEEEYYLEEKDKLVEELSQKIVDILFNENAFEPEDKEFGL
ncbi:MAG: hypothetical protein HON47_02410 [Candidatus Diapherotrites archaeon]|jgi:hypothetical protein|uniref:Uncharacterized protein n=1 Tax=Candidatus Iainarchaeum sp. TaxID=3101447 RepID=A0A8T5GEZ7_9ARCH|nr:hypothetical protein [Candidatus Diapherotrites archaeon]MBT7241100.1 hypothetical protein [Candidatus Diapherotrites archaeon]